jgi:hypothetical protein
MLSFLSLFPFATQSHLFSPFVDSKYEDEDDEAVLPFPCKQRVCVCWCIGVLVYWCVLCIGVCWCVGVLVCVGVGVSVCVGVLVCWCIGVSVCWCVLVYLVCVGV